jgi:hypothetical protein
MPVSSGDETGRAPARRRKRKGERAVNAYESCEFLGTWWDKRKEMLLWQPWCRAWTSTLPGYLQATLAPTDPDLGGQSRSIACRHLWRGDLEALLGRIARRATFWLEPRQCWEEPGGRGEGWSRAVQFQLGSGIAVKSAQTETGEYIQFIKLRGRQQDQLALFLFHTKRFKGGKRFTGDTAYLYQKQ